MTMVLVAGTLVVLTRDERQPAGIGVPSTAASPVSVRLGSQALAVAARPITLRIPAIELVAAVGTLGLNPDRTVQVPGRPERAGWYRGGPSPGQAGSAVILGHVDSLTGPAVFYRIRNLHRGDAIVVSLAGGGVARFVVDRLVTYPNAKFPAQRVYGARGRPELQLVTCGGTFDHRTRGYTANVVAYTTFVSATAGPWLAPLPGLLHQGGRAA